MTYVSPPSALGAPGGQARPRNEGETMNLVHLTIGGSRGLYDEDALRRYYNLSETGISLQYAVNRKIAMDTVNEERCPRCGDILSDDGCDC